LVSAGLGSTPSNGVNYLGDISADGKFVAFYSLADNLVVGDVNSTADVFVWERQTGTVECISKTPQGVSANALSLSPRISGTGRFVTYHSLASDLDPLDSNSIFDVYIRDRVLGVSERVSVSTGGIAGNDRSQFPSVSDDGRYISFRSEATNLVPNDTNGIADYFVRDRFTGTTERVSVDSLGGEAIDPSFTPAFTWYSDISFDGRFVVFASGATNLVQGDTNGIVDVFLHDRQTSVTERVSVNSNEEQGVCSGCSLGIQPVPSVSDLGRFVVFVSSANNLAPNDINNLPDVFVRDRVAGVTELVNISDVGIQGDAQATPGGMSRDGRYVTFTSTATTLVTGDTNGFDDVFVHDRMTGGPDVALSNVVAGQTATLSITGATPGGIVVLGASLLGQGILPTAWGPLELNGVSAFFVYVMDGAGKASVPVWLDPALLGLPLWVQGIDLTMDFPTSVWGGTIQ